MLNNRVDTVELIRIVDAVANEKSIDKELVITSMEEAIEKAARTRYGQENNIYVSINRANGQIELGRRLKVVENPANSQNEISLKDAQKIKSDIALDQEILEQAEIQIKYDSYIEKEQQMVEKLNNMEDYRIPLQFDYLTITALSAEGKQKLNKIKPETLGQASRISGVTPADLSILTVYLGR